MPSMLRALIKTHRQHKNLDDATRQLFIDDGIQSITPSSSFREVFAFAVLFHADRPLSSESLNRLRSKIYQACSCSEVEENPTPTMEKFVLLPVKEDVTLHQLSKSLTTSQRKRFIDETFSSDSMDYLIDQLRHPQSHTQGFFQKVFVGATLGLLAKISSDLVLEALVMEMQFTWVDDGATNKDFEAFLTKRSLKKAQNAKADKASRVSVKM